MMYRTATFTRTNDHPRDEEQEKRPLRVLENRSLNRRHGRRCRQMALQHISRTDAANRVASILCLLMSYLKDRNEERENPSMARTQPLETQKSIRQVEIRENCQTGHQNRLSPKHMEIPHLIQPQNYQQRNLHPKLDLLHDRVDAEAPPLCHSLPDNPRDPDAQLDIVTLPPRKKRKTQRQYAILPINLQESSSGSVVQAISRSSIPTKSASDRR